MVQDAIQTELTKEAITTQVVGLLVPAAIRQEAKEAGVSPGQYALALKATEKGSRVTAEDIRGRGLQKALEHAGADIQKVSQYAAEEKDFGNVKKEIRDHVKGNSDNTGPKKR